MLTATKLIAMLEEYSKCNEIGCLYHFKEKFGVSLRTLEVLELVSVIRRGIPKCGEHCERYQDCKWQDVFNSRKSKSKFQLTKAGQQLQKDLSNLQGSEKEQQEAISNYLITTTIADHIQAELMSTTKNGLTIPTLIAGLLQETNLNLRAIRITLRDILDLLTDFNYVTIKDGVIYHLN
jgi:hypothetical protein